MESADMFYEITWNVSYNAKTIYKNKHIIVIFIWDKIKK